MIWIDFTSSRCVRPTIDDPSQFSVSDIDPAAVVEAVIGTALNDVDENLNPTVGNSV